MMKKYSLLVLVALVVAPVAFAANSVEQMVGTSSDPAPKTIHQQIYPNPQHPMQPPITRPHPYPRYRTYSDRPVYIIREYSEPEIRYVPVPVTADARLGQRLIAYTQVPNEILKLLQPAPTGLYYSMAGQEVFVVSATDHTIVQIIQLSNRR